MSYIVATPVQFQFGSFDYFCNQIALPVCPLVGSAVQKEPKCYARNIDLGGGYLVFEPATLCMHIVAMIMTSIMISHIKFKYTAVGRKEIVLFFYMYAATVFVDFLVISGIIPFASNVYPYFAALHSSMIFATLWCLFLNGFVPFQFIEDGTPMSTWLLRISTMVIFLASYFINIGTFKNIAGLTSTSPGALWTIYFLFAAVFVFFYICFQIFLVLSTFDDKWPIGISLFIVADVLLAAVFFITAQLLAFVFSPSICEMVKHYLDGMFFAAMFNLLAVMMVYKFWDSITKEDLEFAVGCKNNSWEIRDPLLSDSAMATMGKDEAGYGSRL